ncbi:MAG: hypothetical protein F6J96_26365 [Symploca sp. SIO1C2]|nr:hypothetical protein [Symploca sp. SIO1C2]
MPVIVVGAIANTPDVRSQFYWQDDNSTILLAGCQFHNFTGRMPVPQFYWQDASSTILLAG